MRLHLDEKKYVLNNRHGIIKKDGVEYYFKEVVDNGMEMVIERLASIVDMKDFIEAIQSRKGWMI